MRILYHHRTQADDAQGIHIREMIQAFQELGHKVDTVALVETDLMWRKKSQGGFWDRLVKYVPRWCYELMSLAYNLYGYWSLARSIAINKPDLIYERYALNTFCGIWASRHFGIPLILEVNAPLYYEEAKLGRLVFRKFARFSERWICSNSTWTIVVSEVMKEFLIRGGVFGRKLAVIHNAIEPNTFHPRVSGESIRNKYSLDGRLVVGFVGWFRKWHGLETLLKVMSESDLARQNIRLLLVGDGPAFADLYHFAEVNNILPFVVFTGAIDREEIPEHIAAMDVAVQPSVTEYACPIKIIEYMGMGKCIVAPDQPNIREILQDGINALLFAPGDEKHFETQLMKIAQDADTRRHLGQNAYKTLLERQYLWSANASKALQLARKASSDNSSLQSFPVACERERLDQKP